MRTTIILLGLLAAVAMPANGNEYQERARNAIKKCIGILNAEQETVRTLVTGKNFVDKKVACLALCAMEEVGAIKNGKIDLETAVDDVIQSQRYSQENARLFRDIVNKCKVTAEKSKNKCSVAGEFLLCFKGYM